MSDWMQDKLLTIKLNSSVAYFDSIKLSRAALNAYISTYSNDIIEVIRNGGFIVSEPILTYNGELYIENRIIPTVPSNAGVSFREDWLKKRKIKRFIKLSKREKLFNILMESDYESFHLNESNIDEFEEIFVKADEFEARIVEDSRPGINIDQGEYFVREFDSYTGSYGIIVRCEDYKILSSLLIAFDWGISKRRSIGSGSILLEGKPKDFKEGGFRGEGLYILLSPFIPSKNDYGNIDFKKSFYRTAYLSGRGANGEPFGIFKYVLPGSVLYLKDEPQGSIFYDEQRKQLFIFKGYFLGR